MMRRWEPGCYGDGTFGHQHTRERCLGVLEAVFRERYGASPPSVLDDPSAHFLIAALRGEMSDDAWEEQNAKYALNELAPVDGHSWGWLDGDFGLWPDESEGE